MKDLEHKRNEEFCRQEKRDMHVKKNRANMQEVITAEEVEGWITWAAAVDVEWPFRFHGCSEDDYTWHVCRKWCLLPEEG